MKSIEWGFLIVNYLFLGGLSAGLFFVSALATLMRRNGNAERYLRIARYGALLAPWPVMLGCLLLIFDLGKWLRFYKLFLHFRWTSPMSIGSWLLLAFNLVSLLYCYSWLTPEQRDWLCSKLPKRVASCLFHNHSLAEWRNRLALIGMPLSVGVGIYTGVLLGAVQSRPFWNTNLVAQMFLFSALSTGSALLIFALSFDSRAIEAGDLRLVYALDICFMALEFFIVIPYLIHGELSVQAVQDSLELILGGPFTLLFWVFFLLLGLLLPLVIEVWEISQALLSKDGAHYSRKLAATTALLVMMGGFLLRYIFVVAGQVSAFK
jgi:formate-dependent nitrite reductase membrane component NrfD